MPDIFSLFYAGLFSNLKGLVLEFTLFPKARGSKRWLFKKYNNKDLIVVDTDYGFDDDN